MFDWTLPFTQRHPWVLKLLLILVLLIPIAFLAFFFFYPLINIFRLSLTYEAVVAFFARVYFRKIIWFTTWQALLSTVLTLIAGLPAAYLFARYTFPGRGLLKAITTIPFVMPTVVVAAAYRALFGVSGPINQILMNLFDLENAPIVIEQSLTMILLAHVFYNIAVVVRLVGGFWANLNPRIVEAARVLGASRGRAFREVTLPLLRPSLISASLLIFLFTFTSFGVILILGGPQFSTIETEIYRQYVTFLRADIAAVLSLMQIFFTFVLMLVYARWQQKSAIALDFRPQQDNLKKPESWQEKTAVSFLAHLPLHLHPRTLVCARVAFVGRP